MSAAGLLIVVSTSAVARPTPLCRTNGPDVRAIHKLVDQFTTAINHGDVDAMMKAYADDLIYMPNHMAASNKEQTRAGFGSMLGSVSVHISVTLDELRVCGPIAYDLGSVAMQITPKNGGKAQFRTLRFLEILHKGPDGWQDWRVMNNDPPQPAASKPSPDHGSD
jgi:ketosteroid isomerase-like protein